MEYSKYNHLVKDSKTGIWVLYNFVSGALLELDEQNLHLFESILDDNEHLKEKELLIENGFIVDYDENAYIHIANKKACTDCGTLSILIAPTMDCNFACPYCFETHKNGRMSETIQNQVIQFIEKSIDNYHHNAIFVYWFGGEPLLAPDIIESLSTRIIRISEEKKVKYTAAIVTNGYLLDEKSFRMLESHHIERIQVTLDGIEAVNDLTRVLKNGEGSFERIMTNLRRRTPINIVIRCNLSRNNIGSYEKLVSYIKSFNREFGTQLTLYPARMEIYQNSKTSICDKLSQQEFFDFLNERDLLSTQKINDARFVSCTAERIHSYAFDEKGNVYRCWNDVGDEEKRYSTIECLLRDPPTIKLSKIIPYLDNGYQYDKECLDCKFLPICMGGCIMKRYYMREKNCTPIRFNPDYYVLNKYYKENSLMKGGEFYEADC